MAARLVKACLRGRGWQGAQMARSGTCARMRCFIVWSCPCRPVVWPELPAFAHGVPAAQAAAAAAAAALRAAMPELRSGEVLDVALWPQAAWLSTRTGRAGLQLRLLHAVRRKP
jgi:hypothetical protein